MKWTKEPPTGPGFYWEKTGPNSTEKIVEVLVDGSGELYSLSPGSEDEFSVYGSMWWGDSPVPVPDGEVPE